MNSVKNDLTFFNGVSSSYPVCKTFFDIIKVLQNVLYFRMEGVSITDLVIVY